jgi:hypothetical protein
MYKVRTTSEAVQLLISASTRPPQIDYVSPGDRMQEENATKFIASLPYKERKSAEKTVEDAIEAYYGDTLEGSDGQMYSIADLDAMF